MSASREKKLRQDRDPRRRSETFKELEQAKAEKRSNLLLQRPSACCFLVAVVGLPDLEVQYHLPQCNGVNHRWEKYTRLPRSASINKNVYRSFLQNNSYYHQLSGAGYRLLPEGTDRQCHRCVHAGAWRKDPSWHDYMMDNTIKTNDHRSRTA